MQGEKRNPTNAHLSRTHRALGSSRKRSWRTLPTARCQQTLLLSCSPRDKAVRGTVPLSPEPRAPSHTTRLPDGPAVLAPRGTSARPNLASAGRLGAITAGWQRQRARVCVRAGASRGLAPCPSGRSFLGRAAAPLPLPLRARPARGPAHAPRLVYPARRRAAAGGRQVSPHAQESGPRWAAARWRLRPPFAREPPSSEHPKQSPAPPPN